MAIFDRAQQTTAPDFGRDQPGGDSSAAPPRASSGSELKRVVDEAAQRVDEIVDGAEQVASGIIAEAEADAGRYLEGRREEVERAVEAGSAELRGLAERLGQQEGRLRELTEAMIDELEEIAAVLGRIPSQLGRRPESSPESPQDAPPASAAPALRQGEGADALPGSEERDQPGSEGAAGPEAPESPDRPSSHGHENALLRAAQMAVGGSSREEIERALTSELAIRDPGPIVDELFGPQP